MVKINFSEHFSRIRSWEKPPSDRWLVAAVRSLDGLSDRIDYEKNTGIIALVAYQFSRRTPRQIMYLFPLDKSYDGERWGCKDYFTSVEALKVFPMDKPIGKRLDEFLMGYASNTVRELWVALSMLNLDFRKLVRGRTKRVLQRYAGMSAFDLHGVMEKWGSEKSFICVSNLMSRRFPDIWDHVWVQAFGGTALDMTALSQIKGILVAYVGREPVEEFFDWANCRAQIVECELNLALCANASQFAYGEAVKYFKQQGETDALERLNEIRGKYSLLGQFRWMTAHWWGRVKGKLWMAWMALQLRLSGAGVAE